MSNGRIDGGFVYALSGASVSGGDRLFVGGTFDAAGPVGSQVSATNIAMLNPNPTNNPTWSSLGTGAANGTDGEVHSLAALQWFDYHPPFPGQTDRIMVYVGGVFDKAGNITSHSIARWSGVGSYADGWHDIGGGVENNPIVDRVVYGIAVDSFMYENQTVLNGLYLTGNFSKTVSTVVNYNLAKWNGSTWRNIGNGLLKAGGQPDCSVTCGQYPSYLGRCAVFVNGTAYIGGNFDAVKDKNGTCNYLIVPDPCSPCGYSWFYKLSVAKVDSTEVLSSGGCFHLHGDQAFGIARVGATPYVGGGFTADDFAQNFYAAKLVSGCWQSLPVQSGSPTTTVVSVTADSSSVYFATGNGVFRYIH